MPSGDEFLDEYQQAVQGQLGRLRSAVQGITPDQLNAREGNNWSIGQILDHLCLAHAGYIKALSTLLDNAPQGPCEAEMTKIGKKIYEFAGPDKDAPVPGMMKPSESAHGLEVIHHFSEMHQKSADFAKKARGVDLTAVKFRNPVVRLFKMNLVDAFAIMQTHAERHIRQIEARRAA
ncbi:MAG: DinB family protein [Armatimonadota bacterium]